jgi:hypothetical protein
MTKGGIGAALLGALLGGGNSAEAEERAALARNPNYAKNCMALGHALGTLKNCTRSLECMIEGLALASTDAPELMAATACQFDNIVRDTEKACREVTNLVAERLTLDPRCEPKKSSPSPDAATPSTLGVGRRAASSEPCAPAYKPGDGKGF